MALHRCATNNAGQLYLAIEANCREFSLQLWSSHSTSKYKYITFYSSVEQYCIVDKYLIIAYLRGKSPLKNLLPWENALRKMPQRRPCPMRIVSME